VDRLTGSLDGSLHTDFYSSTPAVKKDHEQHEVKLTHAALLAGQGMYRMGDP
jgi:hypothetical protein